LGVSEIAAQAAEQLEDLIGRQPQGVTALGKTDDGWRAHLEVIELRRIPEATDILALYEVDLDFEGSVVGYRRLQRYTRGQTATEADE